MTFSSAQEEYLLLAAYYQQWQPGLGLSFSLWSPGRRLTGKTLVRAGFIELKGPYCYRLSGKGWSAAEQIQAKRRDAGTLAEART